MRKSILCRSLLQCVRNLQSTSSATHALTIGRHVPCCVSSPVLPLLIVGERALVVRSVLATDGRGC